MADNNHKYGFRWFQGGSGRPCPAPRYYTVASAYQAQDDASGFNVDLNIGDPVKRVDDGTVALANGGDLVYGIIVAVAPYYNGDKMIPHSKLPGGTTWSARQNRSRVGIVIVEPGQVWEVDADDKATATTEAAYEALIHTNFDHACAGVSADKAADPMLDISSSATTAGLEWRMIGISPTKENKDFSGSYVKVLVSPNATEAAGSAATPVVGL